MLTKFTRRDSAKAAASAALAVPATTRWDLPQALQDSASGWESRGTSLMRAS
jgi:hypothetical protein